MKGNLDAGQLQRIDYRSLQALAKDMGVNAAGKADDIIARIVAVEVDVPEGDLTEEKKSLFDAEAAEQEEAAQTAAGLVKVKAVIRFLDKQLNQIKDVGEAYSVSRERAAQLVAAGVAEIAG